MRSRILAIVLPLTLAASAASSWAAPPVEEDETPTDARLEGFSVEGRAGPLKITPPSGNAGTWILTLALGVGCMGVMCKNGKRTHLD